MTSHPSVLIENWLPIEAIGAESKRERGASSALPPLYFLHVWWARRPLLTSRAAILASVLPQWSADWPKELRAKFPTEASYHQWFIHLVGIRGDPVQGRKIVDWAKARKIKLDFHPYGGAPRAFATNPAAEDIELLGDILEHTWGTREPSVLDPFAGGGSIPFEALRYGFRTLANDLNPVAAVILKATLDYPARFGTSLGADIRKWGKKWSELVRERLKTYYPRQTNDNHFAYLWARTVLHDGKLVPLSANWRLRMGEEPVAVRLIADEQSDVPRFEIIRGAKLKQHDPSVGTIRRGEARSPWTNEPITDEFMKEQALSGRMGQILYAIALKVPGGIEFRVPTAEDLEAVRRAEQALAEYKPKWVAKEVIPTEQVPNGNDKRPLLYGQLTWADFFAPRQLFAMGTYVETLQELSQEIFTDQPARALAIVTYLGLAISKCVDYNSRQTFWDPIRGIRHAFSRHDFAFRWNSAEFDAARNLLPWAVDQVASSVEEIAKLAYPAQLSFEQLTSIELKERLSITQGSASNLPPLANESVDNITVDPPYYDNVQYAELSDFFYVWLKRTLGKQLPEFFRDELTNKDDEAVANPARFENVGGKKKDLAETDYELKMAAAFREMYRVLKTHGVLTVMFTHKRVEAWDTLASALIGAGFSIKASWPVHTEGEHSLHIARRNAASSTILLVCRKRESDGGEGVWWDDLQGRVRETARQKAEEFAAQGISGVDLYISTFGPTLSIISEQWPVLTSEVDDKTGQPRPLRPETALDLAREEVVRLRKEGLLLGRDVQFDPVTDWYLMAWDAFKAKEFPYDEARKLAIALGLELDATLMRAKRLVAKKGQFVVMQEPVERRRKGMVDEDAAGFEHLIDAVHTAMMIYDEDGGPACDVFLRKSGLKNDTAFKAVLQAMLNAIPRTRIKGKWVRPEAETLEAMRLAYFDDLVAPVEEEPELPQATQMALEGMEAEGEEEEEEEDDEGEE